MSEKLIARKGDKHDCPLHGEGEIIDGFDAHLVEGLPVARVGDRIQCPDGSIAIIEDNDCCLEVDGKKVARIGDKTSHGGTITTGASSVTAEDDETFIFFGEGVEIEIGENVFFGSDGDDESPESVSIPDDLVKEAGSGRVESVAPELALIGGRALISGLVKLGKIVFGKKIDEDRTKHMFRNSEKGGHFTKDTPEARKRILDLVSDKKNYLGYDKHGTHWYGKKTPDGQLWAKVREGKVTEAGINKVNKGFSKETGLSSETRPNFKPKGSKQ
jgi:uncharacterized Zn-binding protein involved in type VI secretion